MRPGRVLSRISFSLSKSYVLLDALQGNRTCDICKTMVKNLPEVPPQLPDSATTQNGFDENGEILRNNALILSEQTPSGADVVFDCIRVSFQCAKTASEVPKRPSFTDLPF